VQDPSNKKNSGDEDPSTKRPRFSRLEFPAGSTPAEMFRAIKQTFEDRGREEPAGKDNSMSASEPQADQFQLGVFNEKIKDIKRSLEKIKELSEGPRAVLVSTNPRKKAAETMDQLANEFKAIAARLLEPGK
jgi:hypothetical protein